MLNAWVIKNTIYGISKCKCLWLHGVLKILKRIFFFFSWGVWGGAWAD